MFLLCARGKVNTDNRASTAVSDMYKHKPMYEYMNTHIIIPPMG